MKKKKTKTKDANASNVTRRQTLAKPSPSFTPRALALSLPTGKARACAGGRGVRLRFGITSERIDFRTSTAPRALFFFGGGVEIAAVLISTKISQ